jgi:hypothetical protein
MILIKIALILIFTVAVLVISLSDKYRTHKRMLLFALYISAIILIVSPSIADTIAGWFSIQYGSDLAVYLSIAILVMFGAVNFARGFRQSKITTTIIRELAIKDVKIT